jgi:hypothetical protein
MGEGEGGPGSDPLLLVAGIRMDCCEKPVVDVDDEGEVVDEVGVK